MPSNRTLLFIGFGVIVLAASVSWWVWGPTKGPDLKADISKIDTVLKSSQESDSRIALLATEIAKLRQEAKDREQAAVARETKAEAAAKESAKLQVRVGKLEEQWGAFQAPKTLAEAKRQLETATDLISSYKIELNAKDNEITELRAAIQELTDATHAQDIALAKAEVRDEMRKEIIAQFTVILEGIRADLKEEREQRARERWLSLIPIVGAVLILFGAH